jgi:hypothetical protein
MGWTRARPGSRRPWRRHPVVKNQTPGATTVSATSFGEGRHFALRTACAIPMPPARNHAEKLPPARGSRDGWGQVRGMRPSFLLVMVAVLQGAVMACVQIGTDTGPTGSGPGTASAPAPSSGAQGDGAAPTGTGCGLDPTGAVQLCRETSLCPGLMVDPGAYPDCGFRLAAGGAPDIECVCGDVLCPLGVPQSCDQAASLLAAQNSLLVCQQVAEGRCLPLTAPDDGKTGGCDRTCASTCAGAPDCLVFCGC